MTDLQKNKAKQIVKKATKLYQEQRNKSIDSNGFHHPMLCERRKIVRLMLEFEQLTGEDWDQSAEKYLKA